MTEIYLLSLKAPSKILTRLLIQHCYIKETVELSLPGALFHLSKKIRSTHNGRLSGITISAVDSFV